MDTITISGNANPTTLPLLSSEDRVSTAPPQGFVPSGGAHLYDLTSGIIRLEQAHRTAATLHAFFSANKATGGFVNMLPEYHFCPVLIADSGQTLPLYKFVEVLDSVIDYDNIKEEFPFLSYAQINGAILFLRKLAQCNSKGVDIDESEDDELLADEALIEELRQALADQEISRVLNENE